MKTRRLLFLVGIAVGLLLATGGAAAQPAANQGHETPVVMETITVTAERVSEYVKNHPQQVTVLERGEILKRNILNVEEALNTMPGVDVRKSSGIGSRISIRGSGKPGGVLVLLDGRPLNTSQYGGVDLAAIPMDIVQSIVVFKPPVPVWLGPGATDGAISIVTHDFARRDDKAKKSQARMKTAAGSYGLAEGSISRLLPLTDGSVMLTAAGERQDGKRINSDKKNGTFNLHWDREAQDATRYEVNGRYYLAEYGCPGPTDNPTPRSRQRYEKGAMDSRIRGVMGETGDYSIHAYGDVVALKDKSQSGLTSDLDDVKFGFKTDTHWSQNEDVWALRLGGIVERNDVDHTLTGDHHRVNAGLSTQYDRHFGSLAATMGVRADHAGDFGFNPGYSGGLSYSLSKEILLKANGGYSVNVPTFGQLYQPSHGSVDQVRGNPDLEEEKVWSYDLGLEYRIGKDQVLQATLFRTDTRDLIVYQRGEDLIYRPIQVDKAYRHGLEITAKYGWGMGLTNDSSFIAQDSKNRDNGKELAYTPRYTLKTTFKYTLSAWDTRLEATLRYEDDRFSEVENRAAQRLEDYVTVDVKAIQPFAVQGIPCEWFVHIDNLMDRDFQIHQGYPDDGIRFVTGITLTF